MAKRSMRGSYPHPVLDDSDDMSTEFSLYNASVSTTANDVDLQIGVVLNDPDILNLIENNRATLSFRWFCASTLSSGTLDTFIDQWYPDNRQTHSGFIDQQLLRGVVRVEAKVIATDVIPDYSPTAKHPDYGNASFSIAVGDVLADGGSFSFQPGKLYDPLNPPVSSCFNFVRSTKKTKTLEVQFDRDDSVIVQIPEKTWESFTLLEPNLQIGLVVLPALMETIGFIQDNERADISDREDTSTLTWYSTIKDLMEAHMPKNSQELIAASRFDLAQRILEGPYGKAISMGLSNGGDEE